MRIAIIIISLLLFLSVGTTAQDETTINALKSTLKSIKKTKGINSLEYVDALTELATLYNDLGDHQNALKQIEKANDLIEKRGEYVQKVKNHPSSKPETFYPLRIKIIALKCQIYRASKKFDFIKITLQNTYLIDYGLESDNLKLVEKILSALYCYFDFDTPFFQQKWKVASTPEIGVPKELRFLKALEKSSKLKFGEYSEKHTRAILNLAVFYKQNRLKSEFDSLQLIVDRIAPDTLSKMEINSDQMPRFPGCEMIEMSIKERKMCADEQLLKFIYSNISYPKEAWDKNIKGMVIIQFVVTEKGRIKDATIIQEIGAGCGEEALRVINLMNDLPSPWIPGVQDDKMVRVQYELPIRFLRNR